jgi:hypothetical protein
MLGFLRESGSPQASAQDLRGHPGGACFSFVIPTTHPYLAFPFPPSPRDSERLAAVPSAVSGVTHVISVAEAWAPVAQTCANNACSFSAAVAYQSLWWTTVIRVDRVALSPAARLP